MEDDLIDVGDCGWRVNQPGNSAIPRFRDFCLGFLLSMLVNSNVNNYIYIGGMGHTGPNGLDKVTLKVEVGRD